MLPAAVDSRFRRSAAATSHASRASKQAALPPIKKTAPVNDFDDLNQRFKSELRLFNQKTPMEKDKRSNTPSVIIDSQQAADELEQLRLENQRLREINQALIEEADYPMESGNRRFSKPSSGKATILPVPAIDRRRIMLLKAQNIQMQRHILALSEAIDCRHRTWAEIEQGLTAALESSDNHAILLKMKDCMRHNIDMRLQRESRELSMPVEFAGIFKSSAARALEFRQICEGQLDYVSVSQCAQLEQDARDLYAELYQLNPSGDKGIDWPHQLLDKVLNQLLQMSLLVPAASHPVSARNRGRFADKWRQHPAQQALDSARSIINGPNVSLAKIKRPLLREMERLEAIIHTHLLSKSNLGDSPMRNCVEDSPSQSQHPPSRKGRVV